MGKISNLRMLVMMFACAFLAIGIFLVVHGPVLQNRIVDKGVENLVEKNMPSVVHVLYESEEVDQYTGKSKGWQGSGVIIDEDGLILTARHVVEKPGIFTVTLADGTKHVTKKAVVSKGHDVGYLKIDAANLPVSKFGNSDDMKLGGRLVAIGSPWGKEHFNSVTLGVLSGLNLNATDVPSYGWSVLFQSDVSINPGNSGGPVYNIRGQLVGIAVGGYGTTGSHAGISYCIPSNICKSFVRSAWLSFALQEVTPVVLEKRIEELEEWQDRVSDQLFRFGWSMDSIEADIQQLFEQVAYSVSKAEQDFQKLFKMIESKKEEELVTSP